MKAFLQRFASVVAGVLSGFDRLVFKGKLTQLYLPEAMHCYLALNRIRRDKFKAHAAELTQKILKSPVVEQAKELERYRFLNSTKIDKEKTAREIAAQHQVREGLVCVLSCVEPCWTFDSFKAKDGSDMVLLEPGKCSHLYHYYIHPQFGWMYVRLQTWFPFEMQIGINGREWLARQMDREGLAYERSDNKFLAVGDWQRAQQLLDEQLQTDWVRELDALQQQFHPLHPRHLGRMRLRYNWTVFQSEWATDVAWHSTEVVQTWFDRFLRQALLSYDSVDILRFLGRVPRLTSRSPVAVKTSLHDYFEGRRIKHWMDDNSLKMYNHLNVLRVEMTINIAEQIKVLRRAQNDPRWHPMWRPMRRTVLDLPQRAEVGQQVNERYLEALAATAETRTLKELAEPLTQRVPEPRREQDKPLRKVRALNPLAADDAALLTAISKPEWMISGLRNRDLVTALYTTPTDDAKERRRRSNRVTRLLRLLRGHGLLEKIPGTHRYQVRPEARPQIQALLACRNANPDALTANAA
jgi:hypothetical protein